MIFNEQLQQRRAYNRQALEEAWTALDGVVNEHLEEEAPRSSEKIRIDRRFPVRRLTFTDLMEMGFKSIEQKDVVYILIAFLLVTLMGMVIPYVTKRLYDEIIPTGIWEEILPVLGLLVGASVGAVVFTTAKVYVQIHIQEKVEASIQAAMMERTFSMPTAFFRQFSSGDMSHRVMATSFLCHTVIEGIISNLLTLLFSFIYLYQVIFYARSLLLASVWVMFVNTVFMLWEYYIQQKTTSLYMPRQSRLEGFLFGLFSGIQKIKTSGSEVRAFSKWAKAYRESRPSAQKDYMARFSAPVSGFITVAGLAFIFQQAVCYQVPIPDFMAFLAAFGMVSAGFSALSSVVPAMATSQSLLQLLKPIMRETPEVHEEAIKVHSLSGGLQVHNLSFRYDSQSPYIFKDFNLKINPGEYVAIVGHSGCGKSTLLRLLLGFEQAESGAIFYDSYNLGKVDKRSLRQHIGTCMQDGELFSGDLLSNITITAPWVSEEEAWEAARLAAVDEDIAKMPMKMHTLLSSGGTGISGGQRQRILIARALVNKPSILFFDEATSALDNLKQKQVSANLDALHCTRICIAHRLSTIVHCDRIIVIDGGKVAEEGTYQALLDKKGLFYQLVKHQL